MRALLTGWVAVCLSCAACSSCETCAPAELRGTWQKQRRLTSLAGRRRPGPPPHASNGVPPGGSAAHLTGRRLCRPPNRQEALPPTYPPEGSASPPRSMGPAPGAAPRTAGTRFAPHRPAARSAQRRSREPCPMASGPIRASAIGAPSSAAPWPSRLPPNRHPGRANNPRSPRGQRRCSVAAGLAPACRSPASR